LINEMSACALDLHQSGRAKGGAYTKRTKMVQYQLVQKKGELSMTRIKILGLAIGASLLLAYEPIANATPMAAPLSKVEASTGNFVVQARVHHGVAIRTTRRHVRRGY
jgi:hypothetical protein